jgi:hypothetical protein
MADTHPFASNEVVGWITGDGLIAVSQNPVILSDAHQRRCLFWTATCKESLG